MALIYEPKGPALEYSELACNLYKGCGHECAYCYAPYFAYRGEEGDKKRELFVKPTIRGKPVNSEEERVKILLKQLESEVKRFNKKGRVLLSFTTDPYQPIEEKFRLTRQALEIFGKSGVPVTVLTKNKRVLEDLNLFVKYDVEFATTICFLDENMRQKLEPNASTISERLDVLAAMKGKGLSTWVSLEPVVDPDEALKVIDALIGKTGKVKVGTVDKRWDKDLHEKIKWAEFLEKALMKLYGHQTYYIKHGMWKYATDGIKEKWPKEG